MKINNIALFFILSCITRMNIIEATFIYLRNEFGKPITYRTSSHSDEATIPYHAIQVVGSDYSPEQLEWNLEIKSRSSFFSSIKYSISISDSLGLSSCNFRNQLVLSYQKTNFNYVF